MTDQAVTPAEEVGPAPEPSRKSRAQIAKELFGNEYKGPVEETASKTEEAKPVDTEADEEAPIEEEPAESGETAEGSETAPAEEEGETPITTFSELVDHYGLDPEWAKTL